MASTERDVPGLSELGEFLRYKMPEAIRKKYLARATFDAAEEFEKLAIIHAHPHYRTGALEGAMAIFKRRGTDPNHVAYAVGVRKIRIKAKERRLLRMIRRAGKTLQLLGDPYYYYFLERGTSKMPAYPFLRPAFDEGQERAINAFALRLRAGVESLKDQAR